MKSPVALDGTYEYYEFSVAKTDYESVVDGSQSRNVLWRVELTTIDPQKGILKLVFTESPLHNGKVHLRNAFLIDQEFDAVIYLEEPLMMANAFPCQWIKLSVKDRSLIYDFKEPSKEVRESRKKMLKMWRKSFIKPE